MISASQKPVVSHNSLNGVYLNENFRIILNSRIANLSTCFSFFLFLIVYCSFGFFFFFLCAEFAFIHSKFLSPLPPNMDEFMCSLRMVFPHVLDVNHLMKEIGPLKKVTNLSAAASCLKRRFFVPIDMEIPHQGQSLFTNLLNLTTITCRRTDTIYVFMCASALDSGTD